MMRRNRLHLWFLQIAALAIAGMAWTSGGASACATKAGAPSRACCVIAPAPAPASCCETDPLAPPARRPSQPDAPADSGAPRITDPTSSSSCECRASDPASPAEHQSRTSTDRLEAEGFGLPVALTAMVTAPPRVDRSMVPGERPPKIPVYLQTSRLLN